MKNDYITNEGKALIAMFKGYELNRYYCKHTGNLELDYNEYLEEKEKLNKFLEENNEYVIVGFDEYGNSVEYSESDIIVVYNKNDEF